MAKNDPLRTIDIQLSSSSYPIVIGHGLFSHADLIRRAVVGSQVLIVTNEVVAPLYLTALQKVLNGFDVAVVFLKDGEEYKNQVSLTTIYDALIRHNHHRDTTLIALGGGVVGDITGFAAATYQRGVRYIQCPTTLLAQVDASVGGKTAINHSLGKNMIGSFYQPSAVFMDLNTLDTLPARELNAGLAEVIKYAVLVGGEFMSLVTRMINSGNILQLRFELADLITQCCQIKADIVIKDEQEFGCRALLNLGHTFAHALESVTDYQRWLHGEAVAIGLYCAALLSRRLGHLNSVDVLQLDQLLAGSRLPRRIPRAIDLDRLIGLMWHDKKIKNNQLRFVLIKSFGDCYLNDQVTADDLYQVLLNAVEGDCE